ncbi:TetR/AcrR family transcriptional regulator C-terminal domain-containing protein [Streptomyces sp. A3M-1-3]|uniref:TetR/AcrR family transcriptional regulator C-terminal domain-containing protein n=1 Tax=Streptomyces sp. A3M-1-3 TaxID=2962044 RepID=UPI0020B8ABAC|nr:TetR/AcrR family transcriptional regulator C-terminal domain-containing protein [Streptomyces sp. A3M-1-3]MCP3819390.1 TetR/AcrR family transcriptional regulator C-terminal domain-containing protein [Streptomyces sp. A3M-1-3]
MSTGSHTQVAAARPPLNRERIVAAALRIIDDEGVDAVSMRRIGADLDVQAMSLYNHVRGKADILDGVTEYITMELNFPLRFEGSWEDGVRTVAHNMRRSSLRHPRACELVLSRQLSSPTVLAPIDTVLSILLDRGFDEATAVHALRTFIAYQIGSLLREANASPTFSGTEEAAVGKRTARLAGCGFPAVERVAPVLAAVDFEAEFTFGVEMLISALQEYAPRQA